MPGTSPAGTTTAPSTSSASPPRPEPSTRATAGRPGRRGASDAAAAAPVALVLALLVAQDDQLAAGAEAAFQAHHVVVVGLGERRRDRRHLGVLVALGAEAGGGDRADLAGAPDDREAVEQPQRRPL